MEEEQPKKAKRSFPWWILLLLLIVACAGLAATPAWDYVYKWFVPETTAVAQLRVSSPDSTLLIYIDDEYVGETSDGTLIIPDVSAQRHTLKLIRDSSNETFYAPFERELTFMEGSEVEIEWLSGPTLSTSQGVIRYFRERPEADSAPRVFFVVYPDDANVMMDNLTVDPEALSAEIPTGSGSEHTISVSKEGYETSEFVINTGLFGTRRDADLVIEVYLYQPPILISTQSQ